MAVLAPFLLIRTSNAACQAVRELSICSISPTCDLHATDTVILVLFWQFPCLTSFVLSLSSLDFLDALRKDYLKPAVLTFELTLTYDEILFAPFVLFRLLFQRRSWTRLAHHGLHERLRYDHAGALLTLFEHAIIIDICLFQAYTTVLSDFLTFTAPKCLSSALCTACSRCFVSFSFIEIASVKHILLLLPTTWTVCSKVTPISPTLLA